MSGPMQTLAMLVRRVRFHLARARFERELAEEMEFHVEMKAQENEHGGMDPASARQAAQRRVGNASRVTDAASDVMAVGWVDAALQDARYTLRSLRSSPGFTTVAVASLALGIGATTAVFTLVNAMLLRPLPFPSADRLVVTFQTVTPGVFSGVDTVPWTYGRYQHLLGAVPAFADAGYASWDDFNLRRMGPSASGVQPAERIRAELVTTSLFPTLGGRPLLGRTIGRADSIPSGGGTVAVLSESLWRRVFGGDSAALGASAMLGDVPVTIVGVMPASFTGIREHVEMWVPLSAVNALGRAEGSMGTVIARLRPGVSLAAANAQIPIAMRQINAIKPPPAFGSRKMAWSGGAVGFAEARRHPLVRPMLTVLSVAVGGVLLIVCANIAGLLLARARARESELGVRVALGAGRSRLVRQLLTESTVLALLGLVPGIALAYGGATLLARLRPTLPPNFTLLRGIDLLQGASLVPDWRVLGFAVVLSAVAGLLFGVAPALAASRVSVVDLIQRGSARGATTRARGRRMLVVGQVAAATMFLIGAGLMIQSFRALLRSDIGFDPSGLVIMKVSGGDSAVATLRSAGTLGRIAGLPGVVSAATHNCVPFASDCSMAPITNVDDRPAQRGELPPIEVHVASRDFLRTAGLPLRSGRWFGGSERPDRQTAVVVNESAARLLWPGRTAIGHHLAAFDAPPLEVIGVVADAKYGNIDDAARPALYVDAGQFADLGGGAYFVRTRGDPSQIVPAVRRLVAEADPTLAIHEVTTGTDLLARAASSTRFVTTLLVGFSMAAALLAALGVYGVLAYLVTQRRREFGVRMAIGAQPSRILALVVRQGVWMTLAGLVLGVGGALMATRVLRSFLFGVAAADVATYAAIVVLVGAVGVLAALIPARRATRVAPATVLRE